MNNKAVWFKKKYILMVCFFSIAQMMVLSGYSQYRQKYLGFTASDDINGMSFLTPSTGFVAFSNFIGFTQDSGATYVKNYVTYSNTNFNNYSVNLTFGFHTAGVLAFSVDSLFAYGDFGTEPTILFSSNQGQSWTVVFHRAVDINASVYNAGVTDMKFPGNGNVGFAVHNEEVIRTTNRGQTWNTVVAVPDGQMARLSFPSANVGYAIGYNKFFKTANGGSAWSQLTLPQGSFSYIDFNTVFFTSDTTGYIADNGNNVIYRSTNGASTWTPVNDFNIGGSDMFFTNDSTGYLSSMYGYAVFKTTNSGKTWEICKGSNSYQYLNFGLHCLSFYNPQIGWTGGNGEYLMITTNGAAQTIPVSHFKIDTTNLYATGIVHLVNYSKTGYQYKWYKNDTLLSTAYNASYTHHVYPLTDTIELIVTNGIDADTSVQYAYFSPPVIVSSFIPDSAATGATVHIKGKNFTGLKSVSFGGVNASSITFISDTLITAVVGTGASGIILVTTNKGIGQIAGFNYIPPPAIVLFNPTTANSGSTITISGANFSGATAVSFGGQPAASFNVISSSSITAVVPDSTVSGNITVTTPGGTASLGGFFILPAITSFSPMVATTATTVIIKGTGLESVTAIDFGGAPARSFIINSATSITAVVDTGASGNVNISSAQGIASLPGFIFLLPPAITTVSPLAGHVGSVVTISGSHFSSTPANNIVYFGPVRATVSAATTTSLTVTVPIGATFQPVSVTTNNLTAYSKQPFILTFPNGGSITSNSFSGRANVSTGISSTSSPYSIAVGDFNGDGKVDMAVANLYDNELTVLVNNGIGVENNISFSTKLNYASGGDEPYVVATGDLDGDGKLDIAVASLTGGLVSVFRNTSTGGNISFAPKVDYSGGNVVINDVDGDGKPDLIVGNSVLINNSTPGNLNFTSYVSFSPSGTCVASRDLDGDGKPDFLIELTSSDLIVVVKNNSTPGNFSFGNQIGYSASFPYGIAVGDIDGDGKPDIATVNANGSNVSVFKNTSANGVISFGNKVDYICGNSPVSVCLSDVDGDGMIDLITTNASDNTISVFKNISTADSITFAPLVSYPSGGYPQAALVCDIDGEGRPDIAIANQTTNYISVYINNVQPDPFISSFSPKIANTGTAVTITGSNFTQVSSVSFGGIAAASFVVNSPNSITALVGSGATGNISVTTNYGTDTISGFVFGTLPVINSFTPTSGPVGTTVTISGSNFSSTSANNVVYFGGAKAIVVSSTNTSIVVTVPNGATYQPITVTTANLTAFSAKPFIITFPDIDTIFSAKTFGTKFTSTGAYENTAGQLFDLNNDGKLDIILGNVAFINTAVNGKISFGPPINILPGLYPYRVAIGDMDGDGKPDIVTGNYNSRNITIIRNTSVDTSVSFGTSTNYSTGGSSSPTGVVINDLDNDGRPDVIVSDYTSALSIFKNISSVGQISLGPIISYALPSMPSNVFVTDVDGDDKPDIVVSVGGNYITGYYVAVFRNISTNGNIAFANYIKVSTPGPATALSLGDLNGDGKPDLVVGNGTSNTISVFMNTSTAGNISFSTSTTYPCGSNITDLTLGDLNGDGKLDIVTQNISSSTISVFQNNSTNLNLSFLPKVDYTSNGQPNQGAIGDINGDGIPDLVSFLNSGLLTVYINKPTDTASFKLCPPIANGLLLAGTTGLNYQWKVNKGSGFITINDDANYSGSKTDTLILTNIPSSYNRYQYQCAVDNTVGILYNLDFSDTWTGSISSAWENPGNWSCGSVPDNNTDVIINSGTVILNSNTTIRSLSISKAASLTVMSGKNLIVSH